MPPCCAAPVQRHNPRTDRFPMHKFHHVEFWCGDATNTSCRRVVGEEWGWGWGCAGDEAHSAQCWVVTQQGVVDRAPAPVHRHIFAPDRLTLPASPPPPPYPCSRFGYGMGLTRVAKSDQSTGNHHYASYVMQSGAVLPACAGAGAVGCTANRAPYAMLQHAAVGVPPLTHSLWTCR